jgi:hypothetical protein
MVQSFIGVREGFGEARLFGIGEDDKRQHVYCIGKSGTGKSTLLRNLIVQDIEAGRGVGLIDPHGDLAEEILELVPRRRTDDLIYLDAGDLEHPVGINLLEQVADDERHLVVSNVVSTFRHLWAESWGPRSEYILANAVAALLEFPAEKGGATLLGVPRMLVDEHFRARVLSYVTDPRTRAFWELEFEAWPERLRAEAAAPLENKAGRLVASPVLRHILGQVRSTIRPAEIMDHGRVLLCNLAKGRVGEGEANLLGSLILTGFQLAAMRRAASEKRTPFQLYIDEFHNFTTESFASVLSESRKYGLGLTLAGQYLAQVTDEIRAAVLGNVGTLIAFRLGADDAAALAREFEYPPETLTELGRGEVCARLLQDGAVRAPFIGKTLPPLGRSSGRRENLLRQSRMRYARPRVEVERRIGRWLSRRYEATRRRRAKASS